MGETVIRRLRRWLCRVVGHDTIWLRGSLQYNDAADTKGRFVGLAAFPGDLAQWVEVCQCCDAPLGWSSHEPNKDVLHAFR